MKARTIFFVVAILCLNLVLTGTAATGSAAPPNPTGRIPDLGTPWSAVGRPAPTAGPASPDAPAVALGQPGTAFRYVRTFGVTEEAYLGDAQHLSGPNGLFVDAGGNLYVAEEYGSRVLKYNSGGANVLNIGKAGFQDQTPNTFNYPKDVALDVSGNIWVVDNHRVSQFNAAGENLQVFPSWDNEPWRCDSDNGHFCEPRSIAFDDAGRMFVADRWNHRVQVFSMSSGSPVYIDTIGVTGESGSDSTHFNAPSQIAFDSSGRLYIADVNNFRVQRCAYGAVWTCETFHGTGIEGDGPAQLRWAFDLGIDKNDNIYIADGGNGRVKKCTVVGNCSIFAGGLRWPADVAITQDGGVVYVSDFRASTVRKYSSGGSFLGVFAGTSGAPYVADTACINAPWGVALTSDGGVVVTEYRGYRVVKFDVAGTQQWSLGEAGVWGDDNAHFGSDWAALESDPAVDA